MFIPPSSKNPASQIIVALDVPTIEEMIAVVDDIGPAIDFYKVGLEIYTAEGPKVVKALRDRNKRVFLDLKLHDIPRTVAHAVSSANKLGVDLLTIHAAGGRAMMAAAREAAEKAGDNRLKLLAITTLTSRDQQDLTDVGISRDLTTQTLALGALAIESGTDGLVCSPREVKAMREQLGPDAILVTPGVRPAGADLGDQKRVATPASAINDGATYLVIGRPIVQAPNRAQAAADIIASL